MAFHRKWTLVPRQNNKKTTVKSPNFVTEHNFVTTSKNVCKRPFRFLFKISSLFKKHNANEIIFSFEVLL